MTHRPEVCRTTRTDRAVGVAMGAVGLVAMAGLAVVVDRAQRGLKADLLRQVRTASCAIDVSQVTSLSWTPSDTLSDTYRSLKDLLARVRDADPRCRFAYLMGRVQPGEVVFIADSEPVGSPDESPAGQVYEEAPAALRALFDSGRWEVQGPWRDRWGTWVSGFVPLTTPRGFVVFGMDIDAAGWRRMVAQAALLPGLLVVTASGLLGALLFLWRWWARSVAAARALEQMFLGSPVGLAVVSRGVVVQANPRLAAMLGTTERQLVGVPLHSLGTRQEDGAQLESLEARARAGEVGRAEVCLGAGEGGRHALVSAVAMGGQGDPSVVLAFLDISDRLRAEQALRDALAQRDLLLREIHHRVKNNLQTVVALVRAAAEEVGSPQGPRAVLEQLEERIRAMALLYDQVYRMGQVERVAMDSYLASLVEGLNGAFADPRIRIHVECAPLGLPPTQAMACGLIVTEAVTNALKHAFPPTRASGQVEVRLHHEGDHLVLQVRDDGVGWEPQNPPAGARASGLEMARLWATHQLGGTLELEGDGGAVVRVRFPKEAP